MFVAGSSLKAKLAVFTVRFFSLLCHCMRCISLSLRVLYLGVQLLHVLIGHCASYFEFEPKFPSYKVSDAAMEHISVKSSVRYDTCRNKR